MALAVVTPYDNQREIPKPLVISSFTEITGVALHHTIVQKYCSLHVRGNLIVSSQANAKHGARNVRKIHLTPRNEQKSLEHLRAEMVKHFERLAPVLDLEVIMAPAEASEPSDGVASRVVQEG